MYRVLVVDDSEENLFILKNALNAEYKVSVVKDGQNALNVIQNLKPDIILLDVMMPGMNGYETLTKIKRMKEFVETPVIFITAESDIKNKNYGFEVGAVDYITKPYELSEVKSRVKTHLELSKSREEKRDLLGKTLVGTIQALLEIFSMTNKFAYSFSDETKKLAVEMSKDLGVEELWKVEIASMLSLIGTCTMPEETLMMIFEGRHVPLIEQKKFSSHPLAGSKLISKIPRLEDVAEIIKNHMEPLGELEFDPRNTVLAGSQILSTVINYQKYILGGCEQNEAMSLLKQNRSRYNTDTTKSLERIIRSEEAQKIKTFSINDLKEGMIINEDIHSQDGSIVVERGSTITTLIIEHLRLLNEMGKINDNIKVKY